MTADFVSDNIGINDKGHLTFADCDVTELAETYKTPLYLMDEQKIRSNMRIYKDAFKEYFPEGSYPLFASKAASFKELYRIAENEGVGIDVVSSGELYTALQTGFNVSKAMFHSNNKTDEDIDYGIKSGIGYFVVDNIEEIEAIDNIAKKYNVIQKILLRITPGIDTHTYAEVNTGLVDSKFGSAIETGQASEITKQSLLKQNISLEGYHCHVGSMIFEEDVFERTASIMLHFISDMRKQLSFNARVLNLGGGYGVRYVSSDPYLNIQEKIASVADTIKKTCSNLNLDVPIIHMEPGRSIVADAGMTIYTAGTIKRIPGYKNYVSVDGGMTDNPRFALYKSKYTCFNASKMHEEALLKADLVGRCCESGDIVQPGIMLPESTQRGDIIAVCTTGAYNYSMASNYNRIPRPAVVMLNNGATRIAVRRETLEDIASLDV